MNLARFFLGSFLLVFFISSCEDLKVKNSNDPDYLTAFSGSENITKITSGLIHSWFQTVHEYNSLALGLLVASDAGTCPWGITMDYSKEPRIEFNNHSSYSNAPQNLDYYRGLYYTLASANDVLSLIEEETAITDTTKALITAVASFAQGLSLGYLGLIYDRSYIVTHKTNDINNSKTSSYKDVIDTAIVCLDRAIAICKSNIFTIPSEWLPGDTWNSNDFARLASSFAARLMVYSARNKNEDNGTNWDVVHAYAKNGIQKDFAPLGDRENWYSFYHIYSTFYGWVQTDMYIANMLDPAMPSRWVNADTWDALPAPVTSHRDGVDDRIFTDFQYLSSCPFRPERGYYHFSCYRYKRLDQYVDTWTGPMPEFRKTENDYLLAEAATRVGKVQEAADIMNASARATRGGLPALPANEADIMKAIHHERMVELMISGSGIQYFQMRKENKLQKGTPLHFPIPESQLDIMKMDYYTFGGTTGIPGADYSTGGW